MWSRFILWSQYMADLTTFLGYNPFQLLVPAVLFVILSPGLIMTVPPKDPDKRWFTLETSCQSIVIHSLVFTIVLYTLRKLLPAYFA